MKPNCYFLLLCISILLCFSSCDKKEPEPPEPPQLTPMTTTGAETLSFLKDGEVWIADQNSFSPSSSISSSSSRQFSVSTDKKINANEREHFGWSFPLSSFEIRDYYEFDNPSQTNFVPLKDSAEYCIPVLEPFAEYSVVPADQRDSFSYIKITHLDPTGDFPVVSGCFQLKLAYVGDEGNCEDTILITEGRFDLKFTWKP